MNSYTLSKKWFKFCFANPDKIRPNHTALYFYIIEHCNNLGWKEKFGLPTSMAKTAIGIHSTRIYGKTLNELIEFGFIKLIKKSTNQYCSNVISLIEKEDEMYDLNDDEINAVSKNDIALNSAVSKNDKANTFAMSKSDTAST